MRRYAEGTEVPVERSRAELEKLFKQAGATGFMIGWDTERGMEVFQCRIQGRFIKVRVQVPKPEEFKKHPRHYYPRTPAEQQKCADAEYRRRWRAQVLIAKAKLELIAGGESSVEREFLADIMLPDGRTVAEALLPQLARAYTDGGMPPLLLGSGDE